MSDFFNTEYTEKNRVNTENVLKLKNAQIKQKTQRTLLSQGRCIKNRSPQGAGRYQTSDKSKIFIEKQRFLRSRIMVEM